MKGSSAILTELKKYVGVALAAALLLLFLRKADWAMFRAGIHAASWSWLFLAVVLRFVGLTAGSLRWQALMAPVKRVRLSQIFRATLVGMSSDLLVAMQSAEFVRPFLLSQWEGIPFSSIFATVIVEWFVDLLGILALAIPATFSIHILSASGSPTLLAAAERAVVVLMAAALLALGLLWAFKRLGNATQSFLRNRQQVHPSRLLERISCGVTSFSDGLTVLGQPRRLFQVTFYSIFASFSLGLCTWAVLNAFGLTVSLGASLVLLVFIALGGLIPTPGAVGGFHAACQLGLAVISHIDPARTILPIVALHAILYFPPALGGILCMGSKGLELDRMRIFVASAKLEV